MNFGKPTIYTILFFLLGLTVAYWIYGDKEKPVSSEKPVPETIEVQANEMPDGDATTTTEVTQAQYSEDNPPPRSVDPFTMQNDFEVVVKSSKNKQDFDFDFGQPEDTPTHTIENGAIDFQLVGRLLTRADLENIAYLTVEIYNNDQISFTRRKSMHRFDLAFVREKMERSEDQRIQYNFDLHKAVDLTPGLYYYTIVPAGRNRVLYANKFLAKEGAKD